MPHKKRRHSKKRGGYVSEAHLGAGVEQMMQMPAYNVQWMPDVVEYYVHKKVVDTLMTALVNLPPIELYGHSISLVVTPNAKESE